VRFNGVITEWIFPTVPRVLLDILSDIDKRRLVTEGRVASINRIWRADSTFRDCRLPV